MTVNTQISFSQQRNKGEDFIDRLVQAINFNNPVNFATATATKKPTCKPTSFPCGKSCQPATTKTGKATQCKNPLQGQPSNMASWLQMQKTATSATSSTVPPATSSTVPPATSSTVPPATSSTVPPAATGDPAGNVNNAPTPNKSQKHPAIRTNDTELDTTRNDLISKYGQQTVEKAEKNIQKIFNDPDNDLYIRVPDTATLTSIAGTRFKPALELHGMGLGRGQAYQTKRDRVERKLMGIPESNQTGTLPAEDRPIYGYLGGKDTTKGTHQEMQAAAYGNITVKLKPGTKKRATFTGSDSFKSGVASELINDSGNPPPPSAASFVAKSFHGFDRDKVPPAYAAANSMGSDQTSDQKRLSAAAKAKTPEELADAVAPHGVRYVEAQIYGQVKGSDIAEIHFDPKYPDPTNPDQKDDRPDAQIASWAKANGVKLIVKGAEVDLDNLISPQPNTKRLTDALERGDFNKAANLASDITKAATAMPTTAANKHDKTMALLAQESGFADKPKITTNPSDITDEWKKGGHLLLRGGNTGDVKLFQTGDYYVGGAGGTMYGNGMYAWHAGHVTKGQTVPPPPKGHNAATADKDGKDVWAEGASHGYIQSAEDTTRMALPANAKVTTQTQVQNEIKALNKQIDTWAATERAQIAANPNAAPSGSVSSLHPQALQLLSKINMTKSRLNSDYAKTLVLSKSNYSKGYYPNSGANPQKLHFKPKGASWRINEKLPDSFELSDNSSKKNTYDLITPLGSYSKLSNKAAQQQATEDYIQLESARSLIKKNLSDDGYRFGPQTMIQGTSGGIQIPSDNVGATNIDIRRRVEQDSTGQWIIKDANNKKMIPYDGFYSEAIAKEAALNQYLEEEGVAILKGTSTRGGMSPQQAALVEFDIKVSELKQVLYGDSCDSGGTYGTRASGRYGIVKGYDGVMLNESYSENRMFVLYNRSKVLVDQNSFDFNTGKKQGAAV